MPKSNVAKMSSLPSVFQNTAALHQRIWDADWHEIEVIKNYLAQMRVPADRGSTTKRTLILAGNFKMPENITDISIFMRSLEEEFARYPSVVQDEAIIRLRRKCPWLPSIAEVVTVCEELMAEVAGFQGSVRSRKKELVRRDQEQAQREKDRKTGFLEFKMKASALPHPPMCPPNEFQLRKIFESCCRKYPADVIITALASLEDPPCCVRDILDVIEKQDALVE